MLEIKDLNSVYEVKGHGFFKKNKIHAVENANLSIQSGKIIGLVGESGCGKSTLGKTILKLIKPYSGSIQYHGQELVSLTEKQMLPHRKNLQIIFQDPYSSLNPRLTIYETLTEGLQIHTQFTKEETIEKVLDMLNRVNLKDDILYRYPHEFSGGQRQRIAIARVLVLKPEFVVCDEVVSALDVSTQAQVINLMLDYKKDNNLSYLFISHDLSIVSYIADEIAIMYLGKIIEFGQKEKILNQPLHPYTKALFASTFELKNRKKKMNALTGEIPGVLNKPSGCYFQTRCPVAKEECKNSYPPYKQVNPEHYTSCFLYG